MWCHNKRYQVTQETVAVLYYFLFPIYVITRAIIARQERRKTGDILVSVPMSALSASFLETNSISDGRRRGEVVHNGEVRGSTSLS